MHQKQPPANVARCVPSAAACATGPCEDRRETISAMMAPMTTARTTALRTARGKDDTPSSCRRRLPLIRLRHLLPPKAGEKGFERGGSPDRHAEERQNFDDRAAPDRY